MKRGELWVARAELYATKARPVLIVQSDEFVYNSVIACLVTTYDKSLDQFRIQISPNQTNGLTSVSYLMFDKIFSFDKNDLAEKIGILDAENMAAVDAKLKLILGLS